MARGSRMPVPVSPRLSDKVLPCHSSFSGCHHPRTRKKAPNRRLGVLPVPSGAPLFKFVVAIVGGAGVGRGSVTAQVRRSWHDVEGLQNFEGRVTDADRRLFRR
jgi:hypothetical protein